MIVPLGPCSGWPSGVGWGAGGGGAAIKAERVRVFLGGGRGGGDVGFWPLHSKALCRDCAIKSGITPQSHPLGIVFFIATSGFHIQKKTQIEPSGVCYVTAVPAVIPQRWLGNRLQQNVKPASAGSGVDAVGAVNAMVSGGTNRPFSPTTVHPPFPFPHKHLTYGKTTGS